MNNNRSYSPALLAADDHVVYALVPELKDMLEHKFSPEQMFISVDYAHLWEFVHIQNEDEYVALLHIDWPNQEDPITLHFKQNQWKFLIELQNRGVLGLMYDFYPETSETSGVLMLVNMGEKLDFIIEQIKDVMKE